MANFYWNIQQLTAASTNPAAMQLKGQTISCFGKTSSGTEREREMCFLGGSEKKFTHNSTDVSSSPALHCISNVKEHRPANSCLPPFESPVFVRNTPNRSLPTLSEQGPENSRRFTDLWFLSTFLFYVLLSLNVYIVLDFNSFHYLS